MCVCSLWCIYMGRVDEYTVPTENGGDEKEAPSPPWGRPVRLPGVVAPVGVDFGCFLSLPSPALSPGRPAHTAPCAWFWAGGSRGAVGVRRWAVWWEGDLPRGDRGQKRKFRVWVGAARSGEAAVSQGSAETPEDRKHGAQRLLLCTGRLDPGRIPCVRPQDTTPFATAPGRQVQRK